MDKSKLSVVKFEGVKFLVIRFFEIKECVNDIIKYCNLKIYKNNFVILDCL